MLFADGTVAMDVIDRGPGWARLKVVLPGMIRSHQGINVPLAGLNVAALTDKDLVDLEWTATHPSRLCWPLVRAQGRGHRRFATGARSSRQPRTDRRQD